MSMARGRATNGSGMQPRKRKDGLWECRYTVGTDPGTGKPVRKSVYGKTAAEAAEKLRAATASIDAGTYQEPQKMRLKNWLGIWLTDYKKNVKPNSLSTYTNHVNNHIVPALGMVRLCDLHPHNVQCFINSLQEGDNALSANSVHSVYKVLNMSLNDAQHVKYLADNPAKDVVLPKVESKKITYFEDDEIQAFNAAAVGDPFEELFSIALDMGGRISELLGLRWSRLDFTENRMTIDVQLMETKVGNGKRYLGTPKNSKPRSFKVAPSVMARFRAIQRRQREAQIKAGSAWCNDDGLVFTDEIGRSVCHATVRRHFETVMKKAGLSGRTFHSLRHTFAIEAIRAGVDVKTVSEMLGHASTAFTLDVYASVTKAMENTAANLMEAWINKRSSIPH